ncbi:snoRNA-binding rRNA-processing protein [Thoreauomyces humboldtii]|nr:snoRNA-binding rRNA-processing protein [Thoreauomyces humboldtii]
MGVQKKSRSLGPRHDPLHVQMAKDASTEVVQKPSKRAAAAKAAAAASQRPPSSGEAVPAEFLDSKTSRKILNIVREQQEEIEREGHADASAARKRSMGEGGAAGGISAARAPLGKSTRFVADSDDEAEDELEDGVEYDEYEVEDGELDIDAADQHLLDTFMAKEPRKQMNLSDLIMGKIAAAEAAGDAADAGAMDVSGGGRGGGGAAGPVPPSMNEKIIDVYTKVGLLLSRYKSGKLPKTFKIIPSLADWEDVLYLTHPEKWTPQATYQATRIFVSNLKDKMAQRFFALVLLDRIRDDIAETKKLNYHLYMSLKKALYKPAAFFKGLLLPLCETGTCTLREAAIVGSVISKVSIPVLHSAAGLLKLAEMDYSGANSLFIRVLLDKKYALPFKVVDALVFHFIRFKNDDREMPVLWHQALLVFAQRYKEDMTPEQKDALLELIRSKTHDGITPEIRRELAGSASRAEIMEEGMDIDI